MNIILHLGSNVSLRIQFQRCRAKHAIEVTSEIHPSRQSLCDGSVESSQLDSAQQTCTELILAASFAGPTYEINFPSTDAPIRHNALTLSILLSGFSNFRFFYEKR